MALSDNTKGALLMMGAMTAFTLNDALMKSLAGEVPLVQAIFLRGLLTCAAMIALTAARGQLHLRPEGRDRPLVLLRTAMEVAAVFLYLSALFHMPIANATAILQALPLAVTLAAALVFREAIGWKRLTAIAVGFLGVLLIVRPGTEGFTIWSIPVLGAVAAITIRDLAVRRMSVGLPSLTVATHGAIGVTVSAGVVALFQPWEAISAGEAATLAAASACLLVAYVLSVSSMRVGEIAAVSPFRYFAIVVALVLGILVFDEWPDALTLAGAALVVATGLFTLWRERIAARRAAAHERRKGVVDTVADSL